MRDIIIFIVLFPLLSFTTEYESNNCIKLIENYNIQKVDSLSNQQVNKTYWYPALTSWGGLYFTISNSKLTKIQTINCGEYGCTETNYYLEKYRLLSVIKDGYYNISFDNISNIQEQSQFDIENKKLKSILIFTNENIFELVEYKNL